MIEQSVAPAGRTDEGTALPESRASRALAIYVQHADAIIRSWRRGIWLVPSCSDPDVKYRVTLLPAPSCSCPDARKNGAECKHILVVRVARRVSAPCAGCGHRFRRRDLYEVGPENVSLGAFVGDRLCEPCGLNAGVL